jgi:hypothetical protein
MVSNLDIWRTANLLIRRHSAEAELEAARLQDLMLEPWQSAGMGTLIGYRGWPRDFQPRRGTLGCVQISIRRRF